MPASNHFKRTLRAHRVLVSTIVICCLLVGSLFLPAGSGSLELPRIMSPVQTVSANENYHSMAGGSFSYTLNAATADLITINDNWTMVPAVEGYAGNGLTATHGVDPQTVLGTEFPGNAMPGNARNVAANKGNPNAFNAGGVAEFDSGTYIALGLQGNVQANPYLVFYLNTLGRSNITITYRVTDIDGGSNNAVSQVALQYRVGNSGNFINLPAGFIADATQGPNIAGQTIDRTVNLPAAAGNKSQVQIRLITTNAASSSGSSTPDEWIGINNIIVTSLSPSAAPVDIGGRVYGSDERGVAGAVVTITDAFGNSRSTLTNTFGFYRFTGIAAGASYIVGVRSKRFVYDVQLVTPVDDLFSLDFYALGGGQTISPPILGSKGDEIDK